MALRLGGRTAMIRTEPVLALAAAFALVGWIVLAPLF
jgi:hypothetical protein